ATVTAGFRRGFNTRASLIFRGCPLFFPAALRAIGLQCFRLPSMRAGHVSAIPPRYLSDARSLVPLFLERSNKTGLLTFRSFSHDGGVGLAGVLTTGRFLFRASATFSSASRFRLRREMSGVTCSC